MMKKAKVRVARGMESKKNKKQTLRKNLTDHAISSLTPYNEKEQMKAYKILYNQEESELMGVGSVIRSIAN